MALANTTTILSPEQPFRRRRCGLPSASRDPVRCSPLFLARSLLVPGPSPPWPTNLFSTQRGLLLAHPSIQRPRRAPRRSARCWRVLVFTLGRPCTDLLFSLSLQSSISSSSLPFPFCVTVGFTTASLPITRRGPVFAPYDAGSPLHSLTDNFASNQTLAPLGLLLFLDCCEPASEGTPRTKTHTKNPPRDRSPGPPTLDQRPPGLGLQPDSLSARILRPTTRRITSPFPIKHRGAHRRRTRSHHSVASTVIHPPSLEPFTQHCDRHSACHRVTCVAASHTLFLTGSSPSCPNLSAASTPHLDYCTPESEPFLLAAKGLPALEPSNLALPAA